MVSDVEVHHLDRTQARRLALRAQVLDAGRPADHVALVEQLTLLQIDPTAAIAPSADLVAVSAGLDARSRALVCVVGIGTLLHA